MPKIAVISNSLSAGGAERVANLLVKNLAEQGQDVILITVNKSIPDVFPLGCKVFSLERKSKANVFINLRTVWNFRKVLKNVRPDVLIVNCEFPELLSCFAQKRIRIIAVEHTTTPWTFSPILGWFTRLILKLRSSEWVSVAPNILIWPFNQSSKFVPNYYFITNQVRKSFSNYQIKRLVFIGRLTLEKNPHFFLDVCKESGVSGYVIGAGLLDKELKKKSKELNLDVEFAGYLSDPWEKCRQGDVIIVPSMWEGDGLVVVEALLLGFPILLADIPDLRRFCLPDTNYFSMQHSSKENYQGLSKQIQKRLGDFRLLIPQEMFKDRILQDRDPELITKKWLDLIGQ
jgi:glycosyltransferase involved in cell wall biosynthesis